MGGWFKAALAAALLFGAWRLADNASGVWDALKSAGPLGVALVTGYHLVSLGLCALAWRSLLPEGRLGDFLAGRWLREAVGELAGVLPLSGEVAGARLLAGRGLRPSLAGALTVVDVTAEVAAQALFSLLGVGLWLWRHPSAEIGRWGLIGLAASLPMLGALVIAQRSSLLRLAETHLWSLPDPGGGPAEGLHAGVMALWSEPGRMTRAILLHLAAWLASTGEAGLALLALGHPLAPVDVIALESIIFALRSIAFIVPAALGVQEGAYVLVGAALGLPPEVALALSLVKRGRELVFGLPALMLWRWL